MNITYQHRGPTLWVQLEGELDHHSASACRALMDEILSENQDIRQLRVNLCGLEFMDSSGIGVLIGRYKVIRERKGVMTLYGMNPAGTRIVEMAGLKKIMNVE